MPRVLPKHSSSSSSNNIFTVWLVIVVTFGCVWEGHRRWMLVLVLLLLFVGEAEEEEKEEEELGCGL